MNSNIPDLIEKITIVETDEALACLLSALYSHSRDSTVKIGFVNAHGFNMAWTNMKFIQDLLACDCVFRDGSGMKILYKLLGRSAGLNLNGTDLIPRILADHTGKSIALLGTSEPYLSNAAKIIEEAGGNVVAKVDGFQPENAYIEAVLSHKPELTILAMGMPKQEAVAQTIASALQTAGGLIVCGGAILDFIGGKVTRAPVFFRKIGMEWIYRLALEPNRMFSRYVLGNGIFLMRAIAIRYRLTAQNGE